MTEKNRTEMTFTERAETAENSIAKNLLLLMEKKKTNLCLSIDLTKADEVMDVCRKLGDRLAVVKTHIDIIEDFSEDFINELQALADEKEFMIFEDRKFADIGNTVVKQYSQGIYKISQWAHITNAHAVVGEGVIKGLKTAADSTGKDRGCLILAQMTSAGNLLDAEYTQKAVSIADSNKDFVAGFIGNGSSEEELKRLSGLSYPGYVIMTPGVNIKNTGDGLGQRYQTPENAVLAGSDCIIVGRGIYTAEDPLAAADEYRERAWNAYLERSMQKN